MKSSVLSQSFLLNSQRWNAEFFISESREDHSFVYEEIPLRRLVAERKESIEPQAFKDHVFNYIGLENIESQTGDLVNFQPKPGKEIKSRSKIFRKNDVLYGKLRPSLNKCMVIGDRLTEGISTTEVFVLIPNEHSILAPYLRELLVSDFFSERVAALTTGAALPRVNIKDFLELKVPVPSLEVQEEIATVIKDVNRTRRFEKHRSVEFPVVLKQSFEAFLTKGDVPDVREIQSLKPLPKRYLNSLPKSLS